MKCPWFGDGPFFGNYLVLEFFYQGYRHISGAQHYQELVDNVSLTVG